jgi:hypothetical protein
MNEADEPDVFEMISAALIASSVTELDEYAHLTIETAQSSAKPGELFTTLMHMCMHNGDDLADSLARSVPPTFLMVAIRMLCEGLRQDAFHVCHEILLTILDMNPEERKQFWAEHEKAESDEAQA